MTEPKIDSLEGQRQWWNCWDAKFLDELLGDQALRRGATVIDLLGDLNLDSPDILEVGCGNGWFSEKLSNLGRVTGIDIADQAIMEARRRCPAGVFFAGDICSMELPDKVFDVVVTLETFSHVPDQAGFLARIRRLLRPGGYFLLTTQNGFIYDRQKHGIGWNRDGIPNRFVTRGELRRMLKDFHVKRMFTIEPIGDLGFLRFVNSRKLNILASLVAHPNTIRNAKEKLGLGQTIIVSAHT